MHGFLLKTQLLSLIFFFFSPLHKLYEVLLCLVSSCAVPGLVPGGLSLGH